jgi:DNA-binding LacI/PurR family transcriptional regulator
LVLSFSELAVTLCLNIARRLDWHIPNNLSLFSFKAASWMRAMEPAIGVVELPIESAAAGIMEVIFQKIDKKTVAHGDRLLACRVDFGNSMTMPQGNIVADATVASNSKPGLLG